MVTVGRVQLRADYRIDRRPMANVIRRLRRWERFFGKEAHIGWPEAEYRDDSVPENYEHIRWRAHWLEYGTPTQPPRPFMSKVRQRIEAEAPSRMKRRFIQVIKGRITPEAAWDAEARYWFKQLYREWDSLGVYPRDSETYKRKVRKGAPYPWKVGYEFGDMITAMTYVVLDRETNFRAALEMATRAVRARSTGRG